MKNIITFIAFIIYSTLIFFTPNIYIYIVIPTIINIIAMLIVRVNLKKAIKNIINLLPFILLTGIINMILENYIYATYITIKLILVCNITYTYSRTTTAFSVAKTVKMLCKPLELFKINTDDIEILVALGITMVPVLKKEFIDLKNACLAKNIEWKVKNMKIILSRFLFLMIKRVNEIDEALIQKGQWQ